MEGWSLAKSSCPREGRCSCYVPHAVTRPRGTVRADMKAGMGIKSLWRKRLADAQAARPMSSSGLLKGSRIRPELFCFTETASTIRGHINGLDACLLRSAQRNWSPVFRRLARKWRCKGLKTLNQRPEPSARNAWIGKMRASGAYGSGGAHPRTESRADQSPCSSSSCMRPERAPQLVEKAELAAENWMAGRPDRIML